MKIPRALPRLRSLTHILRRRDGAAAIEFAIVASPFIFILFAIVELGIIFVTNINLSNATLLLARQIRTGGIIAPGSSATSSSGVTLSLADFKQAICNKLPMVPAATCTTQLQVDIRTQAAFGAASPNPSTGSNFNNASFCYFSGAGGSIVEFHAYYLWPVATPILLSALVNAKTYTAGGNTTSGSYYVLQSAEAFKIEPNSSGGNSGAGC